MLERFDAALALAGADFGVAAPAVVKSVTRPAATNPHLYRVRVYCRELRAALMDLRQSKSAADLDKAQDYCRKVRAALLDLDRSAVIPFRCMDPSCTLLVPPRTSCWLSVLERALAPPAGLRAYDEDAIDAPAAASPGAVAGHKNGTAAPLPGEAGAAAKILLVRQSVGFLALVAAYLLYFHIDIQLQILQLPALFP